MSKAIEIEILRTLAAGRELASERVLGESFAALLDRRDVAIDGNEPCIMPAGRAAIAEADRAAEKARTRRRDYARGRTAAYRSVGLTRTRYGWE